MTFDVFLGCRPTRSSICPVLQLFSQPHGISSLDRMYYFSEVSQEILSLLFTFRLISSPRKLFLTVDTTDENFMPKRVAVYGGEGDNLKKLSDVGIDE